MAEKLAFQQLGRKRGAGDGDEGSGTAVAARVDRPGQHAFARAALSSDQDRRITRRGAKGNVQRLTHGRFLGLQVGLGNRKAHLLFEVFDGRLEAVQANDPLERHAELGRSERFGKVVGGTPPHGLHRGFDRGIGRYHHHAKRRRKAKKLREKIQPLLVPKPEVQKRDMERSVPEPLQCLRTVAGLANLVVHGLQCDPRRTAEAGVIIHHQYVHPTPLTSLCLAVCCDAWRFARLSD